MPKRHAYVHEAVADAVYRRFPQLTVTSDYPTSEPDGYQLELNGGTKAERDQALAFAKQFHATGLVGSPFKAGVCR